VKRAVDFYTRFGRIAIDATWKQGRGRPGRPAKYTLHPSFKICVGDCASAKRGNHTNKNINIKPLKAAIATSEDLASFLRFDNCSLTPTTRQKRRLSAAVRLQVNSALADALLAGLWSRPRAPLSLWRDAIGAVWSNPTLDVSAEELAWRVRCGLRDLAADGDRRRFLHTLAGVPSPEVEADYERRRTEARLRGLIVWRVQADPQGEQLAWFVETRRELERALERSPVAVGPVAIADLIGSFAKCAALEG